MILAAILLAAAPPTTPDIYRTCGTGFRDSYDEEMKNLACVVVAAAGFEIARKRDAATGIKRLCVPPGTTGQQGADRLRTWLRGNPDRHGDNHAIAADALAESYPCPPPQEPTP